MIDEDLKQLIEGTAAETRRHVDATAENLRQDVQKIDARLTETVQSLRQENAETRQQVGDAVSESSSPTPPRKSRSRARSSPSATARSKDDGKRIPLDVKAGDTILFGKYSGQEIKLDGEEYLIMREDEVLAVIDERRARSK
jgi:chaperonin GroES